MKSLNPIASRPASTLRQSAMGLGVALEGIVAHFLITVDRTEDAARLRVVETQRLEVEKPKVAVAQPHIKIVLRQTETRQALDQKGDEFDLGLRAGFAENIGVELVERAEPALLGALVAIKLGDT